MTISFGWNGVLDSDERVPVPNLSARLDPDGREASEGGVEALLRRSSSRILV
jgi:hypothetical protein